MRDKKRARQICTKRLLEMREIKPVDWANFANARVVDHAVDTAEVRERFVDKSRSILGEADIRPNTDAAIQARHQLIGFGALRAIIHDGASAAEAAELFG